MIFSLDQHTADEALHNAATGRWWSYGDIRQAVTEAQHPFKESAKALLFNFCRNDETSVFPYLAALESGHAVALLDDPLRLILPLATVEQALASTR